MEQQALLAESIKKYLLLNKQDYYETHLALINCILPRKMTPMEIEVLATFMSLDGSIAEDRFGTTARKLVMKKCKLKPSGLTNYITALINKGFLKQPSKKVDTDTNGEVTIHKMTILPILFPNKTQQTYQFRLANNGQDRPEETTQ